MLTRRALLQSLGGAAVALPFLEATRGEAYAQNGPPLRMVVFMHPMGMIMDNWRPSGGETNFTLNTILQPLEPHRSQINIINGLSNDVAPVNALSDGHNSAARTLLTCMPFHENIAADGSVKPDTSQVGNGFPGGPSVEQVVAEKISAGRRFKTVDLMIGGLEVGPGQIFAAGRNDPVRGIADPRIAFDRLFAEVAGPPDTPEARIRGKRTAILEKVKTSYRDVGRRLGAEDRARLESHAAKVEELAARLNSNNAVACTPPNVSLPPGYDPESHLFDDVSAPILIEEAVMSLACDLTRVVTLQFTNDEGPTFPWLGIDVPGQWANWHTMIHEARNIGGGPAMTAAMTWYTEMFALLVRRLSEVQDGNGSLLDNTLVLWVSDFGDGDGHGTWDLPVVLAGNLGGRMQTGRSLTFGGRRTGDLYTAILNAFDIEASCFGLADLCSGPLAGIF